MVQYDQLPSNPPEYDDFIVSDEEGTTLDHDESSRVFEEFDIEDPENTALDRSMFRSLTSKAGYSLLMNNLNQRVVHPMKRMMDPVYELYKNSNIIFDSYLSRIGNPLILKRLIYVFSITAIIYIITASGLYPNQNKALFGDFYDPFKLNRFIETHVNEKSMATTLEYLSSIPHIAGTAGDLTLARYVEETLHNNGLSLVEFLELEAYINYPNISSVELFNVNGESLYKAKLVEPSKDENDQNQIEFRAFNPDSLAGEAKGQLVYVNYGTPEDFAYLNQHRIDLNNKILLIKYGKIPASQKIMSAEMRSAAGVLFISDPEESAYTMDSIQRDGVGVFKEVPGDLLTPGWASAPNTDRLAWDDAPSSPKTVSLPISWDDSLHLFKSLEGKGVKNDDWRITLNGKTYEMWTGASSDEVHMVNKPVERSAKPIWNVIGRITGREQYDKGIIIGAQRDSSCFGAVNPNTGTTVLLELVRLFAKLQSTYNWSPLRSIYFVSFDATNYNLAGSTEWAETKVRELRKEGYAYIDLSDAVSGDSLEVNAHPLLRNVILSSLDEVSESSSNATLLETQFQERHSDISPVKDYNKNLLPFQAYLGIPSMEIKFSGKSYPKDSCLDTYDSFVDNNIDPEMEHHKTLVELLAKIVVKLVEEPLIPFDLSNYVHSLDHFVKDLRKYGETIPGYKGNELDTSAITSALLKMKNIGIEYEGWVKAWKEIVSSDREQEPSLLTVNRWTWNLKLTLFEKRLLSNTGMPLRPWYKNLIFGPQFWQPASQTFESGTFPGVRDALRAQNFKLAKEQLNYAADLLAIAADSFVG